MIIATAGHVDHGKTSLLQAITGINADRLPEEQSRSMSIDLGYVYWPQPDGQIIGFIDVPGHEKFLSNMLSGIGGIDHALLVVAADDGVMPQTREHLAILQLSGRPQLTVAISKSDAVDTARLREVEQQISELTRQLGWQQVSLFATSITSGAGIAELSIHLSQLSDRKSDSCRPFRLAIDRVFTIKGAGLVATGTALAGEVRVGEMLWLSGMNKPVRVRGLHTQNQSSDIAHGGQRVALNLSGGVEKSDVVRGDWLVAHPPAQPCERAIVTLEQHQPLHQGQSVHIHHAASHITGRISLLEDNLAELLLDKPLWLVDNDRLILRDIGARHTLAGARVLVLTPPRRGKRQPAYLNWLHQLEKADNDADAIRLHLQQQPRQLQAFNWARQLSEHAMTRMLTEIGTSRASDWLMLCETADRWQQTLLMAVENYHDHHGDRPGIGRDRLRRMALPNQPEALVFDLIDKLVHQHKLVNNHGWLHLPGFAIVLEPEEASLWQQAVILFSVDAWWVRDLARQLHCDEEMMRQTLRKTAQSGVITAIVKDRYFSQPQIVRFATMIRQRANLGLGTSASDFRDQLGIGRKLAVQILEFFDRCGFTRRKGNEHVLRDARMFS